MRSFVQALLKGWWNPAWLNSQKNHPGRAWRYFVLLALALTTLGAVPFLVRLPGQARHVQRVYEERVPNFEARLQAGIFALTGLAQPFSVTQKIDDQTALVYIDTYTTSSVSIERLVSEAKATSGVLITATTIEVVSENADGKRSVQSTRWSEFSDFQLNKDRGSAWVARVVSRQGLIILGVVLVVVVFIAVLVAQLWSLLMAVVIVYFVARFRRSSWRFGELFTVGLYASTLPLLLSVLFVWINIQLPFVQFVALVALLFSLVITRDTSVGGEGQGTVSS